MILGTVSIGGNFSGSLLLPATAWLDSAPSCKGPRRHHIGSVASAIQTAEIFR